MSTMEEADFRQLYENTARRVYAYVRRRTDAATAEAVVAEVFLKAWRQGDRLVGDPLPWLFVAARTTLYDQVRSAKRRQRLDADFAVLHRDDTVVGIDDVAIDRALLIGGLKKLSEDDREALLLIGWDGLSHTEAATVAGCSVAAFTARVNRARQRLIRHLDPQGPVLIRPTSQEA